MNLNNSYMVTLPTKTGRDFLQVIEADNVDQAIRKARKTWDANLWDVKKESGSMVQHCCKHTNIRKPLKFNFKSGHITIHPKSKDTIFTMYEKALKHEWCENGVIERISQNMNLRDK